LSGASSGRRIHKFRILATHRTRLPSGKTIYRRPATQVTDLRALYNTGWKGVVLHGQTSWNGSVLDVREQTITDGRNRQPSKLITVTIAEVP
jgi:hypothetical protein